ncbi:hypothetical protein CL655_03045 [bacterium]|nr:hypothetical protein [bacterium]
MAVAVAVALVGSPALANGDGSSASATAVAATNSAATISEGTNYGGSSVGAAYCNDSIGIGPVSVSRTVRACIAAEIAHEAGRLGTLSRSEVRAVQLYALDRIGFGLSEQAPTPSASSRTPAETAPQSESIEYVTLEIDGERFRLAGESLADWNSCEIQRVQLSSSAPLIRRPGC